MAKNSIYDYSTTASSNTDIAGIGILGTNAVSNFDDAFRAIMAQIATDVSTRRFAIQGALYGLTLSNNAGDATNDIDIAVGMATTDSTTDPRTMVLSSALTKRLDAAWAVGSGNGWLDTGSIANGTYHVFLIQRSDTGVVDSIASLSPTSPTMPANYDRKRRIGAILRVSGAILAFFQDGDDFWWVSPPQDVSVSNLGLTTTLFSLTVPTGIKLRARLAGFVNNSALSLVWLHSPDMTGVAASNRFMTVVALTGSGSASFYEEARTNVNGQISAVASAASTTLSVTTKGYVDTRGRV